MKTKKRIKTKIGVGSVVKANIGDKEDNIREGRRRWTGKEVVGCVQAVVRNKKFLFQFENKNINC